MHSKLALSLFGAFASFVFSSYAISADLTISNSQTLSTSASYGTIDLAAQSKSFSASGGGELQDLDRWADEQMEKYVANASYGKYELKTGANLQVTNLNINKGLIKGTLNYNYNTGEADDDLTEHREEEVNSLFLMSDGNAQIQNITIDGLYRQTGGYARIENLNGTFRDFDNSYGRAEESNITLSGGTLSIKNLNSNVSIRAQGGVLQADSINLSKKSIEFKGSQLKTGLNQVADFKSVIEKAQVLLMGSNDSAQTVDAEAIGSHQEVSGILAQFKNNVSWQAGSFYFTGSYTQSLANTATAIIKSTFGSSVNVQFEKITSDSTPADVTNGLTAAIANAVIAANGQTAGMIFRQYAFDARNNDLIVGRSGGVTTSVGFTHLNGSHGATVTGGKTLALLGKGGSNVIATGTLIADNGTLRLGTPNTGVTVGGVVNSVQLANNGILNSVRGTYTVNNILGSGTVNVDSGVLNLQSGSINGSLNNKGTLNLGANFEIYKGNNIGTLNTSTIEINDVFNNTGTANVRGAWNFGSSGRYQHTAGILTTIQDNLFENVNFSEIDPLNTIAFGQSVPQDIQTTMTELFQKYVPGNVVESIAQHATFNGGKVIVTGVNLTQRMVDDLTKAFKDTFHVAKKVHFF